MKRLGIVTDRRHRRVGAVVGLVAILGIWDLSRPPERQVATRTLLLGIEIYRGSIGRFADPIGARCRFEPSCSHYAEAVLRRHGALEGAWLSMRRIGRCGPWTPAGTADPPP